MICYNLIIVMGYLIQAY